MPFIVIGNWKMNSVDPTPFVEQLRPKDDDHIVGLAMPYTMLHHNLTPLLLKGAQSCHYMEAGAFTGEVSAKMLSEAGCQFVIIGHSERRHGLHEDKFVERCQQAAQYNLQIVFCVGETETERDEGMTEAVISKQLQDLIDSGASNKAWIAYEPVWAIGTGKAASPEQADQVHAYIKTIVPGSPVLYGGSVTEANTGKLSSQPHIDGFLVGGASLNVHKFKAICHQL